MEISELDKLEIIRFTIHEMSECDTYEIILQKNNRIISGIKEDK